MLRELLDADIASEQDREGAAADPRRETRQLPNQAGDDVVGHAEPERLDHPEVLAGVDLVEDPLAQLSCRKTRRSQPATRGLGADAELGGEADDRLERHGVALVARDPRGGRRPGHQQLGGEDVRLHLLRFAGQVRQHRRRVDASRVAEPMMSVLVREREALALRRVGAVDEGDSAVRHVEVRAGDAVAEVQDRDVDPIGLDPAQEVVDRLERMDPQRLAGQARRLDRASAHAEELVVAHVAAQIRSVSHPTRIARP
jgi:hypothetical protein